MLKLGAYYASGEYPHFNNSQTERNFTSIYGIVDHKFLNADQNSFGLSAFTRISSTAKEALSTVHYYVDAGLVFDSLLTNSNALGIGYSKTCFGDYYERDSIENGSRVSEIETIIEITYQLNISEKMRIQPKIQWIIYPHYSQENAWVIGLEEVSIYNILKIFYLKAIFQVTYLVKLCSVFTNSILTNY